MYLTECILNNLKIHINDTCSISTFWKMYLSNGHFLYSFKVVYSLRSFPLKWQKTLSWCKIMKYYASCVSLHVPDCTNKGLQEVGDFFVKKLALFTSFIFMSMKARSEKATTFCTCTLQHASILENIFTFIYYFSLKEELF